MRLITLNTWSGRRRDALVEFVRREATETDIFCFQEFFHGATGKTNEWQDCVYELYSDIGKAIPKYDGYYHAFSRLLRTRHVRAASAFARNRHGNLRPRREFPRPLERAREGRFAGPIGAIPKNRRDDQEDRWRDYLVR